MPKLTMDHAETKGLRGSAAERERGASGGAVETVAKRGRRTFSAAEKLRIVKLADACLQSGERGALHAMMRVEGIYSSQLSSWRSQLNLHGTSGLGARKPGRKPVRAAHEVAYAQVVKRHEALARELHSVYALLDLQKKAQELMRLASPLEEGTSS